MQVPLGAGAELIGRLNAKNTELLEQLERSDFCRDFFSPETPTQRIRAMTGFLLQQVHGYGGELTRSISTALGRLASYPQWLPQIGPLMEGLFEEITHPRMAHEDSVNLNSLVEDLRKEQMTPAAFAVAAVARRLCEERHPLSHLGFFYLLEGTTSQIAPRLQEVLAGRGIESPFVRLHAKEDAGHADALRFKIEEIVNLEPEVAVEIEYGYDCFATAYPLPIWAEARRQAFATT